MLNTGNKSGNLDENRPWLKFLVLVTLGTIVVAVCFLIFGCSSDHTPEGAVKGKNTKTGVSDKGLKMQASSELLINQEGKMSGNVKKQPDAIRIEVVPHFTREELEAKFKENQANFDPRLMEPIPGANITRDQLKAKIKENQANFDPRAIEPIPGAKITRDQLKSKIEADQANFDRKHMEQFPGPAKTKNN